jgi:hypothetical protein
MRELEKDTTKNDRYKLNRRNTLVVRNDADYDEQGNVLGYRATVTLRHKCHTKIPLGFKTKADVANFICGIDLGSDQLSLLGDEE